MAYGFSEEQCASDNVINVCFFLLLQCMKKPAGIYHGFDTTCELGCVDSGVGCPSPFLNQHVLRDRRLVAVPVLS